MKIIIIGAQAAGASAAAKAKRTNPEAIVRIYEKSEIVSFGACGLPYFVGDQFKDPNEMISRTPEQFQKSGVEIRILHEVIAIDVDTRTIKIKDLQTDIIFEDTFDKLLFAVGASPVIPPIKNCRIKNVFTLKSLHDGLCIKEIVNTPAIKQIVIIGAGYIGLETAEELTNLGKEVRVIQLDKRVLPDAFDSEATNILEEELQQHCFLHVDEKVEALIGQEQVEAVVTNKGTYSADLVIIATGVNPNHSLYQELNIEMLANGAIITDSYGQTSLADIYAAGDCVALNHRVSQRPVYIPLATGANKLGRIAGENLAGGHSEFPGTLGTSAIRVFEIEAARTGITETEAIKYDIPYDTVIIKDKNHSNYVTGQADVTLKLIYHARTRVLLGGQIAGGRGSASKADILAMAIWQKAEIDELAMIDFLYAPPFSRPWSILNIAGSNAK